MTKRIDSCYVNLRMANIAEYVCIRCEHYYRSEPGPTQCPECGHLYVKWLNYEQLKKDGLINDGWEV